MIRFNANLFRLAFTCTSNEETRYYLRGVFVEPHPQGGVTLSATDGHRMLCIRDESGAADESAIINLGDALKQCKPKRNERRDVVIQTGGKDAAVVFAADDANGVLIDTPIAMAYGVRIDGSFPDYRRVVPTEFTKEGSPYFQGRYVAAFGDIACELAAHMDRKPGKYAYENSRADTLRVFCGANGKNPEGSPALVLFPEFDFVFGILMPCRIVSSDIQPDAPSWFRNPTAPIAQAAE